MTIQMSEKASSIVTMVFPGRATRLASMFVGTLLLLSVVQMLGQQSSQSSKQHAPSRRSSSDNAKRPNGNASTVPASNASAVANPFPMAQSEAAAKADEQKSQGNGQSKASQANPFPEAQSKAAAKGDSEKNSGNPKAGSSSSSSGYSSSDANLPPPDLGEGKPGRHERMDSFTRDQTLDGRVQDDLNVADLYGKTGNYRGASLRYQDALQYDPLNDTALYGLADMMCKENLTSEAMTHFKKYVQNNPQGRYVKKAEKMLAHPEKCKRNR